MKRVRYVSMVIAMVSVSVGLLQGAATAYAATPVCADTVWNVALSAQQSAPISMYLTKCGKTLSGTADVGGCKDVISGTLTRRGKVHMTWGGSGCGQSVISLVGTLKVKMGSGKGQWSDSDGASGNWKASKAA